ncbi:MAG TPA: pyrrolo-quinoline quinone [Terriglobales bacterium]
MANDITTYHNDPQRTGQNLHETILTPLNVNVATFGKLFSMPVDGKIDGEPLYLEGVSIPNKGVHNVIYTATENASAFAFDADNGALLWQVSLLEPGETAATAIELNCFATTPLIGVTSTPVIDRTAGPNGTIYLVAMSQDMSGNYYHRLHALDVTTGTEEFDGPTTVSATFPNLGSGVTFVPEQYMERSALLALDGTIYTTWTSHCDIKPYTGWIIGYSATTLQQTQVLNITPNGIQGAIWMGGGGMAADNGNIFVLDGNGTFDTQLNGQGFPSEGDYGNAFIKLSTARGQLQVEDYFTMSETEIESKKDIDLGSGGALVLPPMTDAKGIVRHLAVGAGKDTNIYLADTTNMGKFDPDNDTIYQELDGVLPGGIYGAPAYFNGSLYYAPQGYNMMQFTFSQALLNSTATSITTAVYANPGATPSVSANGSENGIVWAIEHDKVHNILHAYDASNLQTELYNSYQAGTRDHFGWAGQFVPPLIVNGKVYIGGWTGVTVYGLLTGTSQ